MTTNSSLSKTPASSRARAKHRAGKPRAQSSSNSSSARQSRGSYRRQLTAVRPGTSEVGVEAKRLAAVILEVLAGVRTPTGAATALGIRVAALLCVGGAGRAGPGGGVRATASRPHGQPGPAACGPGAGPGRSRGEIWHAIKRWRGRPSGHWGCQRLRSRIHPRRRAARGRGRVGTLLPEHGRGAAGRPCGPCGRHGCFRRGFLWSQFASRGTKRSRPARRRHAHRGRNVGSRIRR